MFRRRGGLLPGWTPKEGYGTAVSDFTNSLFNCLGPNRKSNVLSAKSVASVNTDNRWRYTRRLFWSLHLKTLETVGCIVLRNTAEITFSAACGVSFNSDMCAVRAAPDECVSCPLCKLKVHYYRWMDQLHA